MTYPCDIPKTSPLSLWDNLPEQLSPPHQPPNKNSHHQRGKILMNITPASKESQVRMGSEKMVPWAIWPDQDVQSSGGLRGRLCSYHRHPKRSWDLMSLLPVSKCQDGLVKGMVGLYHHLQGTWQGQTLHPCPLTGSLELCLLAGWTQK